MAVIRIPINKDYTILDNAVLNDPRIPSKYLGVYVRLLSKKQSWEISVKGLAKLYPKDGELYYRSALKCLTKYGYLIRVPQKKKKGKFSSALMILYQNSQFSNELTDEQVDILWSKKELSEEEIKNIYPHVGFHAWLSTVDNHVQENKEEESKEDNLKEKQQKKVPTPSVPPSAMTADLRSCSLERLQIDESLKKSIESKHGQDAIRKAVDVTLKTRYRKDDKTTLLRALKRFDSKDGTAKNIKQKHVWLSNIPDLGEELTEFLANKHTLEEIKLASCYYRLHSDEAKDTRKWFRSCIKERWYKRSEKKIKGMIIANAIFNALNSIQEGLVNTGVLTLDKEEITVQSKLGMFSAKFESLCDEVCLNNILNAINKTIPCTENITCVKNNDNNLTIEVK